MANSRFTQFFYTKHAMPVLIDCNFAVGATGAVGTTKGPGVSSITRLATGIYQVKLQDNYNKFYGMEYSIKAPGSGSGTAAGSLTPGVIYQILTLGTTTTAQWVTAGLPAGLTPAVGMVFKCAATSGGTGTAEPILDSGVDRIELIGNPQLELAPAGVANRGALITVKCLQAQVGSGTTQGDPIQFAAVDPAQNSQVFLQFLLSNSSVTVQGE